MRAQQQVQAFQFEQARMMAPLDYQEKTNELQEQKLKTVEHIASVYGFPPAMILKYMPGDSTQDTVQGVHDMATTAGGQAHNLYTIHTQTDGKPGNGGQVAGYDLAGKIGSAPIKPEDGAQLADYLSGQIATNAAQIPGGEKDPSIQNARALLDQIIKPALSKGALTLGDWSALEYRALTPSNIAVKQQGQILMRQKETAETTRAQQEADPAFQVAQARKIESGKQAAELAVAGPKAAAEEAARMPGQITLKQMEAPIAEGVASNKEAREAVQGSYVKPFLDKMNAANELVSSLGQAEQGNIAASKAAIFKMVGITQPSGQKRVSPETVRQIETMGNVPQQYISKLKNALTGDHWTSEMSQDMKDFAVSQMEVAKNTLRSGVKATNALHGTNIDPESLIQAAGPLNVPPAGPQAGKWGSLIPQANSMVP
jgi:hypothetical protein